MSKGIFITFEGTEGCGKSTQIRMLGDWLKRKGLKVVLTREPGGTRAGQLIRSLLLDPKNAGLSDIAETFLYMAARAELVRQVVGPQLKKGRAVLCDRWLDSTEAYQGYGGAVDRRRIHQWGREATAGIRPDLTLLLDLPLEEGLRRVRSARALDRMEKKELSYHARVRRGFLAIARREPGRVKRVSIRPSDSARDVHEKIKEIAGRVFRFRD